MSDYTYSEQAVAAWRKVLLAKLHLWDAMRHLEEIIGLEFDDHADLDAFAARYSKPSDIDAVSSDELEDFFGPCLPEDVEDSAEGYVYKPDLSILEDFK